MIDSVLNLVFRCSHRRITRPITSSHSPADPVETYVVCLDCGKRFPYDLSQMRIQSPRASTNSHPRKSPIRYLLWASLFPLAWLFGKALGPRDRPKTARRSLP